MKKGQKKETKAANPAKEQITKKEEQKPNFFELLFAFYLMAAKGVNNPLKKLAGGIQSWIIQVNQTPMLTVDLMLINWLAAEKGNNSKKQKELALELIKAYPPKTMPKAYAKKQVKLVRDNGKGKAIPCVWFADGKTRQFIRETNKANCFVSIPYALAKKYSLKAEEIKS